MMMIMIMRMIMVMMTTKLYVPVAEIMVTLSKFLVYTILINL
jgi:hypothetical protein